MTQMQAEGRPKECAGSTITHHRTGIIPFMLILAAALILRLFILSTYSPYTAGSNYMIGKFVASGLPLYSKIGWGLPPLYPYVLGATYLLTGGNYLAIEFTPIIFSLVAMTFAYLITKTIDRPMSGLVVSLVFAVSPLFPWGLLGFEDNVDVPYIALILGAIYFLLKYEASPSHRYIILSGAFAGLSLLTKQIAVLPTTLMLIYAILRGRVRRDLPLFMILSAVLLSVLYLFPDLYVQVYELFSWVTTTAAVPSVLRGGALPSGEKLSRSLLAPRPVDALTFMGVIGCPYLAAKRKNGGALLLSIYLASFILFLVLMPAIDTHHTVLVAPFVLIGAGVFLNDIGDKLPVRSLRKALKPLFLALILGAESILVVYPDTLNFVSSRQLDAQFVKECVKLITEHSSPTDYVFGAPSEAVAISGRNQPPEFARISEVEISQCLETYNVRLLFIELDAGGFRHIPKETDKAYILEHFILVAHVVHHLQDMSPIHYDVFERRS